MPLPLLAPAVYGLPSPRRAYGALVRSTPRLVTYYPGDFSRIATGSNYVMPAQFSLEVWVTLSAGASNRGILSNWEGNNGSMLWIGVDSKVKLHVNATDVDSGIVPSTGVRYHLVGTYDGTYRCLYLNGSMVGGPTSGVTPNAVSTPLISHNYNGSGQGDLAATLADAAIYSRALSPGEVAQHYLAGLAWRA